MLSVWMNPAPWMLRLWAYVVVFRTFVLHAHAIHLLRCFKRMNSVLPSAKRDRPVVPSTHLAGPFPSRWNSAHAHGPPPPSLGQDADRTWSGWNPLRFNHVPRAV